MEAIERFVCGIPPPGEHKQTLGGHTSSVDSLAYSPDGNTLASGSSDNTIRLWDATTGKHKHTLEGHTDWVLSVAFSPDGLTLASGGGWWDNTIRLWDAVTGEHKQTLEGHTGPVNSLVYSPADGTLASGSQDGTILLWEVTPTLNATDINQDGVINTQDLELVASQLGQSGQNSTDVNRDGIVNILDLVLVASLFGEEY